MNRALGRIVGLATAGSVMLSGCGASATKSTSHRAAAEACSRVVRGSMDTPGSISVTSPPPGFKMVHIGQGLPQELPQVTYAPLARGIYGRSYRVGIATPMPDPARIQASLSNFEKPLTPLVGSGGTAVHTAVQGHPALLETGSPTAGFVTVYWKPDHTHLVTVSGYRIAPEAVVAAARSVQLRLPRSIPLPLDPGRIVTRSRAQAIVRPRLQATGADLAIKLSSWAEISALMPTKVAMESGNGLDGTPWAPVWVVASPMTPEALFKAHLPSLAILDAHTGHLLLATLLPTEVTQGRPSPWWNALTDRSLHGCQGGSNAQVPFGVLTRTEENYSALHTRGFGIPPGARAATVSKLTTVAALTKADPSLVDCVGMACSPDQLVWPTITTVSAPPGKTIPCLPASAAVPVGFAAKQVPEYTLVTTPGTTSVTCGPPPAWTTKITDLAPPSK